MSRPSAAERTAALVSRARQELPAPGDPRRLMEDLLEQDLASPEALRILQCTSLARQQLRDMGLEQSWSKGYEWFLARCLMMLAFAILIYAVIGRPAELLVHGAVIGIGLYYLVALAMGRMRLRRHKARREGVLSGYSRELEALLEELERSS